jgi:glucokinase
VLLVGDVGATHARLALISPEHGLAHPVREANLPSRSYSGLEALVREFIEPPPGVSIQRAVLAVAGAVVRGRAELTNLGWVVDEATLGAALGIPAVHLLNDVVALAYARASRPTRCTRCSGATASRAAPSRSSRPAPVSARRF